MKTVGQILLSERKKKKWTLEDVYKFTKIQPKYIKALENSDYSAFSGKVHIKGFLKNYAEFLELDVNQVMAFWRREYDEAELEGKKGKKRISFSFKGGSKPRFIFSPASVLTGLSLVLLMAFFSYLYYQYRTYSSAPFIDIYSPENNYVTARDILDVVGKTEADSDLAVNNQKILLGLDGTFATSIKLSPGINTLAFSVENKLGRNSREVRTVIFRPNEDTVVLSGSDDRESSESSESTASLLVDNP